MRTETSLWRVLAHQGRRLTWLASATGYSAGYVRLLACGRAPLTPEFRARAAQALGLPEDVLFGSAVAEH